MAVGMPKPSLKFLALPILFVIFMFVTLQMFSESIGVSNFKFSRAEEVLLNRVSSQQGETEHMLVHGRNTENDNLTHVSYQIYIEHEVQDHVGMIVTDAKQRKNEEIQLRKKTAKDFCDHHATELIYKNPENIVKDHVRIAWRHRLVYCYIEKIGSTTWHWILNRAVRTNGCLTPNHEGIRSEFISKLSGGKDVEFDLMHWALQNFTKFLVTRNPYTRLLSGYADKILVPNTLFQPFASKTIKRFREGATDKEIKCGFGPTFPEFIKFVNYAMVSGDAHNAHFVPMFDHCRPCSVDFDIIAKMETFEEDTKYILEERGLSGLLPDGNFVDESEVRDMTDMVGWMYNFKNKTAVIECMSVKEIKIRYWRKMQIKGLISIDIDIPDNALNDDNMSKDVFLRTALDARLRSGDRKDRISNRKLALQQAFQSVANEDLKKFQEIFRPDFKLFGYEMDDPDIFNPDLIKGKKDLFSTKLHGAS